ncbi:MAG: hypothetical protein GTO18_00810 [Anaerolineales bacterium]|nr:hypothetical protein [Anaerolineales bacterium]
MRFYIWGVSLGEFWPFTIMAVVLLALFLLLASTQITYQFFKIDELRQINDYLFIALIAAWWAITLRLIWWVWPLDPEKGIRFRFRRGMRLRKVDSSQLSEISDRS